MSPPLAATHSLLEFITEIHEERKLTVLLVTHDLPLVRKHARQIIWLHDGKVLPGTVAELLTPEPPDLSFRHFTFNPWNGTSYVSQSYWEPLVVWGRRSVRIAPMSPRIWHPPARWVSTSSQIDFGCGYSPSELGVAL